ncbi:MAG TPA: helicase [Oxalobacteraceae bacterium]|nr:helicase [Oxalobacteraceae bacterium]
MTSAFELIQLSLGKLTDFQRATVEAVVQQFARGQDQAPRILVADEVGLGKTVVARGVIARMLMQHQAEEGKAKPGKPLRVMYICSNLALASENARKLAIFSGVHEEQFVQAPSFGRLAEIAVAITSNESGKMLEICSLTPATSFTLTHGNGNARERCIIYRALASHSALGGISGWLNTFFSKDVASWEDEQRWLATRTLVQSILADFHEELAEPPQLPQADLAELASYGVTCTSWLLLLNGLAALGGEKASVANHIRSALRVLFVRCCAANLSADLFILDEFQRFRDLVSSDKESEEGIIARQVFSKSNSGKVLLLSATPFKALTHIDDEGAKDAHLEEFRELLRFLIKNDPASISEYEVHREHLLAQLLKLRDPSVRIADLDAGAKKKVESVLRPLICRTERSQVSKDVNSVLVQLDAPCDAALSKGEIECFAALDQLGKALHEIDPAVIPSQLMEFHKAAPWALSFLGGYQFRKRLVQQEERGLIDEARKRSKKAWLPIERMANFEINLEKETPHSKFSALSKFALGERGEQLLWLPPSLPYYSCEGPFKGQEKFSKTLLFSSFLLAPKALSGLLSYQAERRLLGKKRSSGRYFGDHKVPSSIRFDANSNLAHWSLVYPSKTLCQIAIRPTGETYSAYLKRIRLEVRSQMAQLASYRTRLGKPDKRWYALAPFFLDLSDGTEYVETWFDLGDVTSNDGKASKGRGGRHDDLRDAVLVAQHDLGDFPLDLEEHLAELTIAGPANCIYRALCAVWPQDDADFILLASRAAYAIVKLFDKKEGQQVLNRFKADYKFNFSNWRNLLKYAAVGNLQAMLDEYLHLLAGEGGPAAAIEKLLNAVGIMTTNVTAQAYDRRTQEVSLSCHFAVPLGNQKSTDEKGATRIVNVRDAFNSPFWPFVLNSTSIGQEGLDFHWYCSRIVHWNLPSNPIDFEQREGRINRFKGLVVRRRAVERFGQTFSISDGDVWKNLFAYADEVTGRDPSSGRTSDLVPYWHVPGAMNAVIERVVPILPFSREEQRLKNILRILSLYRVAFGQPRQQELLQYLLQRPGGDAEAREIEETLLIDLAPINYLDDLDPYKPGPGRVSAEEMEHPGTGFSHSVLFGPNPSHARSPKRELVWQELKRLEQFGLGRCEIVSPSRDKFVLLDTHPNAARLTLRPKANGFIRADNDSLLFRDAASDLISQIPSALSARRLNGQKGLELRWNALTESDIQDLFHTIQQLASSVPSSSST